jgi:hypothetical protein
MTTPSIPLSAAQPPLQRTLWTRRAGIVTTRWTLSGSSHGGQPRCSAEEPHTEVFAKITELAGRLGDEDYLYYLAEAFTYIPVE